MRFKPLICIAGFTPRQRSLIQPGQWVTPYENGPRGRYMGFTGLTDVIAYAPARPRKVSLLRAYARAYQ